jgi:hypothetical protein
LGSAFFDKYQWSQGKRGGTFVPLAETSQTAAFSLAKLAKRATLTYQSTSFFRFSS